jgi:hypothetical protein
MATVEEVARLIVEAEAKGFAEASAKIASTDASLQSLTSGYKAGSVPLDEYIAKGARLQAELDSLRESYRMADEALKKYGSTAAASAGLTERFSAASSQARIRTQSLAYAFNDFFSVSGNLQQRLNAIANNLPGLFAGMAPKLATFGLALGAIAPIIGMVIANWEGLAKKVDETLSGIIGSKQWDRIREAITESFGLAVKDAKDRVVELAETVEKLDKKQNKVYMDYVDLTAARTELDRIREGLSIVDKLRKKQGEPEKKSGEAVTKVLEDAEGGVDKVLDDLKVKFMDAMLIDPAGPLGKTKRDIIAARKEITEQSRKASELEIAGQAVAAGQVRGRVSVLESKLDALEKRKAGLETEITKPQGEAERAAAGLIARATGGKGADQIAAQADLAKAVRGTGRDILAEQIRGASPAAIKIEQEEEKRAEAQIDIRKEEDKERKQIQGDKLADLLRSKKLDALNDANAKEISEKEFDDLVAYQKLKALIHADILKSLKEQKVITIGMEDLLERTAGQEADQAFARVDRAGIKAARAEQVAGNKTDKKADKDAAKSLEAEAKTNEDALDAEVKKLTDIFGKRLTEDFERITATNAAMLEQGAPVVTKERDLKIRQRAGQVAGVDFAVPADALQGLLRQQITTILRANRATEQGANLTAFNITGKGSIDLKRRQAGIAPLMTRKAKARPAPGKKPAPIANTRKKTAAQMLAKLAAANAGNAVRAATPKPAPVVDLRPREIREREAQLKAQAQPQASLAQPVAGTQDAVAQTQAALAKSQAELAALNLAVKRLQSNANRLNNRNIEQGPTGLMSGSSTA